MARHNFPMSEEQFSKAMGANAKQVFGILGDKDDPIGFAFSCVKAGWLSKMYHKDSQDKRNDDIKKVQAMIKADPELKKRLEAYSKQKGV